MQQQAKMSEAQAGASEGDTRQQQQQRKQGAARRSSSVKQVVACSSNNGAAVGQQKQQHPHTMLQLSCVFLLVGLLKLLNSGWSFLLVTQCLQFTARCNVSFWRTQPSTNITKAGNLVKRFDEGTLLKHICSPTMHVLCCRCHG
jgi:hypothetical protein